MPMERPGEMVRYVRDVAVLGARLGADEMALLGAEQGKYYGLNPCATRIWELLEEPRTLDEICAILQAEYDVDGAQCRADTHELIAELLAERLIACREGA